jgi:hypothetical protein
VDRWYWQDTQLGLGIAAIAVGAVVTHRLFRNDPNNGRAALWFGTSALACLVPAAGALPEDRLLVAAALGTSALFGAVVERAWQSARWRAGSRLAIPIWIALALAVLYEHGYEAGVRSLNQIRGFAGGAIAARRWALAAEMPVENTEDRRVLFLSGADFTTNANLPFMRLIEGHPLPKSYFRLSGTSHVQEIRRTEPNVIEVYSLSSDLDKTMVGSLYRSEKSKLPAGSVVQLSWVRCEVLGTTDGNPWRLRFTFDRSLDDPAFVLVHARPGGLKALDLPAVGGKVRLPRPDWPR